MTRRELLPAYRPDNAFLRDAGDQAAVTREELAASEAAHMAGPGAFHHIEQPFIGTEGIVEPDTVIEAGGTHDRGVAPDRRMGQRADAEQQEIRGIGQDCAM